MEFIDQNKNILIFILLFLVIYYCIYLYIYGFPFKKNKDVENFTQSTVGNKNFSIFEKNKTKPISVKSNDIKVGPYIETDEEDWKEAFNVLTDQALQLESDSEIEDLLNDNDLFLDSDKDKF